LTAKAFLQERFSVTAVGIDPSALLLAEAREARPELVLVLGDGACLPFAPECFGVVFCE
jgi:ubiquinone/menaquinone biosynthesis C-methylase UbiE